MLQQRLPERVDDDNGRLNSQQTDVHKQGVIFLEEPQAATTTVMVSKDGADASGGVSSILQWQEVHISCPPDPCKEQLVGATTEKIGLHQKTDFQRLYAKSNRIITSAVRLNVLPNISKEIYKFTAEEVADVEEEWSATLIGVLVGKPLYHAALMDYFEGNWEVKSVKLYIKENGVLVLKFSSDKDRLWVLKHGPWLVGGNKTLILKEWSTGMAIDWTSFESIPVWAKVIDIDPMLLSSNHMMEVIGNMIGRPISVDHITNEVGKISFARILVEITWEEAKRTEVVLESYNGTLYKHKVEFEWLPWMCDTCNTFGHSTLFCKNKKLAKVFSPQGHGSRDLGSKNLMNTFGVHKTWAQVVDRQGQGLMHTTSRKEKSKEKMATSNWPLMLRNGQGFGKWVEKMERPVAFGEPSLAQVKKGKG